MASTAVIAQCPSCRALVGVGSVVVDGSRGADGVPRAGLPCGACGAIAWLPLATTIATSTSTSASSLAALPAHEPSALPAPSAASVPVTTPSPTPEATAPAPLAPTAAATATTTSMAAGLPPEARAMVAAKLVAPSESQTTLAERFDVLLRDKWHSEADHKALLKAAAAAGDLAFVGARYRAVLDVVRDEPRARAAQNELITMAMATMKPEASSADADSGRNVKLVAAVVLALVIGSGVFLVGRMMMSSFSKLGAIE